MKNETFSKLVDHKGIHKSKIFVEDLGLQSSLLNNIKKKINKDNVANLFYIFIQECRKA